MPPLDDAHLSAEQRHHNGAHTQFKEALRGQLLTKVGVTVRNRAGPSWDERMEVAMKKFQTQSRVVEGEAKKVLADSIEKGRSRATSCPHRSPLDAPNPMAMLKKRQKEMKEKEEEYKESLEALRDKMEKREPLFRLSEVNAAFAMQRERMIQRKREMAQDEHERWEHLRSVEHAASSRPLLIEDPTYRPPKKTPQASASAPALGGEASAMDKSVTSSMSLMGGREEYEKDKKIREAVSQPWFQNSDWNKKVQEIKHRANTRVPLHEEKYVNKGDRHGLTRHRLMHHLPAQVPGVY